MIGVSNLKQRQIVHDGGRTRSSRVCLALADHCDRKRRT